jgi:hypothetical protein
MDKNDLMIRLLSTRGSNVVINFKGEHVPITGIAEIGGEIHLYGDHIIQPKWTPIADFGGWFDSIRVVITDINLPLNTDQINRVSGCLGYALRAIIRGEQGGLSLPQVSTNDCRMCVIDYFYDESKTASDDPQVEKCFEIAARYIQEGSYLRKTNKEGPGTKGTRLVDGIGPCKVEFLLA